ncbi:hypothetical protein [Psychrobacillus soli]|uniref:Uncharacterized protein n=1 Tax=Psychrobacillus soli TaxID=1543965 RepID=A0A544TFQ6_9BACI|nr:hypothetical protein [Psychrobacillus soli]TQR16293.1 hypothetical protein FG383_07340 [Psychrobacillus soli]
MKFLEQVFNWIFIIGVVLLIGRIVTMVFRFLDTPFITFFTDYSGISFIILIVGVIGTEVMKRNKKAV